jgi:tripartite-type tricarboxylate transporter receptor subunit TctC
MRSVLCALFAACVALPAPLFAQSQGFPSRPVRVLLGYTPGGTADIVARILADKLTGALGQPVVVENRPGASGNIAAQLAAKSAADGYTLLLGATAEMAINRHVMKEMGFNPESDFAPVALGFHVPLALLVPAKSPYASLKDLLDGARREPGKLTFANSGSGTPGHLAGELLTRREKVTMTQVPYKGGAPAMTDLIGGRVDAYFLSIPGAMPHVRSGNVRLLAVSTARRSATVPGAPTIAELGIAGFEFSLWGGFFVPAGAPAKVVARLNREIVQALMQADMRARMAHEGSDVVATTPAEFGRFVQAESRKYAEILKAINYKPE